MSYRIKRALETVELADGWDLGQWKLAGILEITNWMGDKPEHTPKTQVKVLYDNNNLYVFFRVEDRYVRAVEDRTHGKVWEDSCVEFFFTPHDQSEYEYFNLETNCGGTMLFRFNDKRHKTETYVAESDCELIEVHHSLPRKIENEITEPVVWTLSYTLPFSVIAQYGKMTKPQAGVSWRANFYKCVENNSHPHWLTWSVVDSPTPNFHLPQYFGVLQFE
jgi:cellulose/xylan binding protein with CBM9 domain